MPTYVRYDDPRVEAVPKGEAEAIEKLKGYVNMTQQKMWEKHRHAYGPTHARTQGVVKGEMIIPDDLPEHLKQSLFATPGTHPIAMRYSTEPGDVGKDDRIPQPRGLGLKVFNVPGHKMRQDYVDGKDIPTQDFEWNNAPALELGNAIVAAEIFGLRVMYADDPDGLKKALSKRKDAPVQFARDELPNTHLASQMQYSQSAFRFGDYVAKFALVPDSETQKKLTEQKVKDVDGPSTLSIWLKQYYAENEAVYLFQAQMLVDPDKQLVEDVREPWDEKKYPFETVATIRIPPQDSFIQARRVFWEDHMVLNPWHGLDTLRPLGGINRLRKDVYPVSNAFRRKLNAAEEITVVDINQIPDE